MKNSLSIGKVYYRFDELPSTNDWASDWIAKSKPPEGSVVRADSQTAGRGQFGSRWESEAGSNLLLSIILYPKQLPADRQFYLSMCAALALHDLVSDSHCRIKWPNDLYIDNRKVAGILIQCSWSGNQLQFAVIGIGMNVNQLNFAPHLPHAGSLALCLGRSFSVDELEHLLFRRLEKRYTQLQNGCFDEIKSDYEAALLRIRERARFQRTSDDSVFEGSIRGVTESGLLEVEAEGAGVECFDLKQIRLLL